MRLLASSIGLLACFTFGTAVTRSGDDKDLRAIIQKGIEAHGGEANIAKFESATMTGTGKFYGLGEGIPYKGVFAQSRASKMRVDMDLDVAGKELKLILVVSGDKGWLKVGEQVMEMPADEVAEEKEGMYAEYVAALVPLKEKGFTLSALGEVKVEGQPLTVELRKA